MDVERLDGIAVLRIAEGKANAIGPAFLGRLAGALGDVERDRPGALVVTGYESYFSAGLDLPSLLPFSREELTAMMLDFSAVMLRLFELPLPVVAAVNGHAVAGGCVLALQADHRTMADGDARIGLKEVLLGIGLPSVVVETLRCQVPAAALLPIALEGRLATAREALALGLVHEVAPKDELLPRALAKARELASLPGPAFAQIKTAIRGPVADAIRARQLEESVRWLDTWFSEPGRSLVRATVEGLATRRA